MDNEKLKKIKEISQMKIAVSNFQKEENMDEKPKKKLNVLKTLTAACVCLIITSGIIFSQDIQAFVKYHFKFGDGIDRAAENGYIEEVEMDSVSSETSVTNENSGNIINDAQVSVKIDEFLMDDLNLSVNFTLEFDEKIKEIFDLNSLHHIELNDLIVVDEEKRIIFSEHNEVAFEKFCKENNLDYVYLEFNENYMNNGYGHHIASHNKEENIVVATYNMYTDGYSYPRSKELDFVFSKIKLVFYGSDTERNSATIVGDWKIHVEVPEKMYNRTNENYKVVSTSNPNFEVYTATVSDTCFEFGTIISNVKNPELEMPFEDKYIELSDKVNAGEITEEDFQKEMSEYLQTEEYGNANKEYTDATNIIKTWFYGYETPEEQTIDYLTHVTNSKGEKFDCTMTPGRKSTHKFLDNDKYDYFETFSMTKYDATDKITMTLIYKGEPVYIEFEKIK